MKIVFLCTSLAAGRDGVGDYTRELAAQCALSGHTCLLVAVNDRALPPNTPRLENGREVRLSSLLSWTARADLLAGLLRDFDPAWISWQLVPYGYHPKGILPTGCFALLNAVRPWSNHVMLHELWLGLSRGEHLRARLVGAVQRAKLLRFLRRLQPAALHTTNPAYQLALARAGWPAEVLPLFGNMPVLAVNPSTAETALADALGQPPPPAPRCLGVIFGTIHPQWNPARTFAWLRAAQAQLARPIALVAIGRVGAHGTQLLAELVKTHPDVRVLSVGAQSPERISHLLQAADFGLATHPWALIEKSGSTATLLEHGLPVLVPRDDWQPREGLLFADPDPLLRRLDDLPAADFGRWLSLRRPPAPRLPALAARFVSQLHAPVPRGALVA